MQLNPLSDFLKPSSAKLSLHGFRKNTPDKLVKNAVAIHKQQSAVPAFSWGVVLLIKIERFVYPD